MFLNKRKRNPGSANQAFKQLRPLEHLLHVLYIYTPDALTSHITSLQNLFIMRDSVNRGFAVRNPYVKNMP